MDVVTTDGIPVVHGVEGGNLVDTHGRHLQDASDLVHDADAGEAVLSLAEIEEGHDGGLFVLGWVSGQDFLHQLLVDGVELEGDVEVVLGCVAVLGGEALSALALGLVCVRVCVCIMGATVGRERGRQ